MVHLDLVFRIVGVIEGFHGTLASAWEFSTNTDPDPGKVFSIMINPIGYKGGVFEKLRKKEISEESICRFSVFPLLRDFDEPVRKELRSLLSKPFSMFELAAKYSKRFWDKYKRVRNVYAHNFRFVLFDEILAESRSGLDESVVGFLEDLDVVANLVYIGATQRIAMIELVLALERFIIWICSNMLRAIRSNCTPVLFPTVPYMTKDAGQQLERICKSQIQPLKKSHMKVQQPITSEIDGQIRCVEDFLKELKDKGYSQQLHLKKA